RLLSTRPQDAVARQLRSEDGEAVDTLQPAAQRQAFEALRDWASSHKPALAERCAQYAAQSLSGTSRLLIGPTGERNSYSLLPRERVLGLAEERSDLLTQLAAALAVGCQVLWLEEARELFDSLPKAVQARI